MGSSRLPGATFRIGPLADAFPWYLGVGPAVAYVSANIPADGPEGSVPATYTGVFLGGVAETGFVFGRGDTIDVALRAHLGSIGGRDPSGDGMVVVGVRI